MCCRKRQIRLALVKQIRKWLNNKTNLRYLHEGDECNCAQAYTLAEMEYHWEFIDHLVNRRSPFVHMNTDARVFQRKFGKRLIICQFKQWNSGLDQFAMEYITKLKIRIFIIQRPWMHSMQFDFQNFITMTFEFVFKSILFASMILNNFTKIHQRLLVMLASDYLCYG